jgi:multidrug transporter EmrE-like cation transporter
MTLQGFLWIVGAALTTVSSNVILRMGVLRAGGFGVSGKGLAADLLALASQPLFLLGMFLYGVAALIWFYIVSTQQLATAYVLLVAIAFIGVTTASHFAFGEPMTPIKILGLVIVLAGIVVTSRA